MLGHRRGSFGRLLAFVGVLGCGAPQPYANSVSSAGASTPVELTLRTSNGAFVDLGDLRDAPTFLFLFATYNELSQAAVLPVSRFRRMHPEVHVVGVAVQPDAALLVDAYAHALSVDFPLLVDPDDEVVSGRSALGTIDGIPAVFVLDTRGVIVERAYGFQSEGALERLLALATRQTTTSVP